MTHWHARVATPRSATSGEVLGDAAVNDFLARQRALLVKRSKSARNVLDAVGDGATPRVRSGSGDSDSLSTSQAPPRPLSARMVQRLADDAKDRMAKLEAARDAARKRDEARYSRCVCTPHASQWVAHVRARGWRT